MLTECRLLVPVLLCDLLDIDVTDEATLATLTGKATTHWHGIISMPVKVSVPGIGKSGRAKAVKAAEDLRQFIRVTLPCTASRHGMTYPFCLIWSHL